MLAHAQNYMVRAVDRMRSFGGGCIGRGVVGVQGRQTHGVRPRALRPEREVSPAAPSFISFCVFVGTQLALVFDFGSC